MKQPFVSPALTGRGYDPPRSVSPDRSSPCDSHPLSFRFPSGTDLQITNIVVENTCDQYTPLQLKTTKFPVPAYCQRELHPCCSAGIYWDCAKPSFGLTTQPPGHWPEAPLLPCFENPPREFWSPNRCVIPIGSFLCTSVKAPRLPFQKSCDEGGRSIAESRLSFLKVNCNKKLLLCGKRSWRAFCGQQKGPGASLH